MIIVKIPILISNLSVKSKRISRECLENGEIMFWFNVTKNSEIPIPTYKTIQDVDEFYKLVKILKDYCFVHKNIR